MKHHVVTQWKHDMVFEADVNGHKLVMDAPEPSGGKNEGPRPKPLMLAALAGCTGMDVVGILRKMRISYDAFSIHIEAETAEDFPRQYTKMKVVYEFSGKDLPKDKLERAVELSREKYCGVSYIYKQAMEMKYEVRISDQ